jgi:hypothetical protein
MSNYQFFMCVMTFLRRKNTLEEAHAFLLSSFLAPTLSRLQLLRHLPLLSLSHSSLCVAGKAYQYGGAEYKF